MKKIAAFLIVVMMFCSASALGESIDLSTMTFADLTELLTSIYVEIQDRYGFHDSSIGSGYYTVGEDIKAGKYELICILPQIETSASGSMTRNQCKLFITSDESENAEILFEYDEIQNGQKIMIELTEGNVLVLVRGNFLIQPFSHSWSVD